MCSGKIKLKKKISQIQKQFLSSWCIFVQYFGFSFYVFYSSFTDLKQKYRDHMFKNAFKYAFENMQTLHYPKLISVPH